MLVSKKKKVVGKLGDGYMPLNNMRSVNNFRNVYMAGFTASIIEMQNFRLSSCISLVMSLKPGVCRTILCEIQSSLTVGWF
jgi:hypothetical protein